MPTEKKRRDSIACIYKMDVVLYYKAQGIGPTAARYLVGLTGTRLQSKKKLMFTWASPKPRARIMDMAMSAKTRYQRNYRPLGLTTALPSACEKQLYSWISELRSSGIPVTRLMICLFARDLADDIGLLDHEFRFSST